MKHQILSYLSARHTIYRGRRRQRWVGYASGKDVQNWERRPDTDDTASEGGNNPNKDICETQIHQIGRQIVHPVALRCMLYAIPE